MNWKGHVGLSLLISSLLMLPFGFNILTLTFIIIAVLFSSLPDTDLITPLEHRNLTHNVGFGMIFAAVLASIFAYIFGIYVSGAVGGLIGIVIFLSITLGVLSHLLGDIISGLRYDSTPWKIKPIRPFSRKLLGYGIFMATDKKVNHLFLKVGSLSFFYYVIFGIFVMYSGIYEVWDFIPAI